MKTTEEKIRFASSIEQTGYFDFPPVNDETLSIAIKIGDIADELFKDDFDIITLGDEGGVGFRFFNKDQNVEYIINVYNDLDIILGLSLREPGTRCIEIKFEHIKDKILEFLSMDKVEIKKWVKF